MLNNSKLFVHTGRVVKILTNFRELYYKVALNTLTTPALR